MIICADFPTLKALEIGKFETGRDIWAHTALEEIFNCKNLETVWQNSKRYFFFIRDLLSLRSRFVVNCAGKIEQFTADYSWIGEPQCLHIDFGAPCGAPQALVIIPRVTSESEFTSHSATWTGLLGETRSRHNNLDKTGGSLVWKFEGFNHMQRNEVFWS